MIQAIHYGSTVVKKVARARHGVPLPLPSRPHQHLAGVKTTSTSTSTGTGAVVLERPGSVTSTPAARRIAGAGKRAR